MSDLFGPPDLSHVIGILIYRATDRPCPRHRKPGKWLRHERSRRVLYAWFAP